MARDYPAQYGRSLQYRNPDTSLPLPAAKNIPIPLWVQTKLPFQWGAPLDIEAGQAPAQGAPLPQSIQYRWTWESPIFDLRPDLRSGQAGPKNGVPLWSTSGRMYLQLFGLTGTVPNPLAAGTIANSRGLTASAVDQGNIVFAHITQTAVPDTTVVAPFNSITDIGPPEDVTSSFIFPAGQPDSAVIGFAPPGTNLGGGEGYPIRYWRLKVTFVKTYSLAFSNFPTPPGEIPVAPNLSFLAAYY